MVDLKLAENFNQSLLLLELDPAISFPVEIKGSPSQHAILCTQNKSFTLRQVSSSNTMLLVEKDAIVKTLDCHYETVECFPRLDIIYSLIPEYCGNPVPAFTTLDLFEKVQASQQEILDYLKSINAGLSLPIPVLLDNHWVRFTMDHADHLLRQVLAECILNDLEISAPIRRQDLDIIIQGDAIHIIDLFFTGSDEKCLDRDRVCRFYGEMLLSRYKVAISINL